MGAAAAGVVPSPRSVMTHAIAHVTAAIRPLTHISIPRTDRMLELEQFVRLVSRFASSRASRYVGLIMTGQGVVAMPVSARFHSRGVISRGVISESC